MYPKRRSNRLIFQRRRSVRRYEKGWIEEVMYNVNRPKICYTKNGISLKEYYRYIDSVIIGEKGFYIGINKGHKLTVINNGV